jgi:hypothetical protein
LLLFYFDFKFQLRNFELLFFEKINIKNMD